MKTSRLRKQFLSVVVIATILQPSLNFVSASAATIVKSPSFFVVKSKAGSTAVTLNFGTKYAGQVVTVHDLVQVGKIKVLKLVGKVTVGPDGKAILVSKYQVKSGASIQLKVNDKIVTSALLNSIPIVAILPKPTPPLPPVACAKAGKSVYPPKAKC